MNRIVLLVLCTGILSACSHEVAVTYNSSPSGATVYEQDIGELGVCPVTVEYNSEDSNVRDDKIYTNKMKVTWVSGATLFVDPTVIDTRPNDHAAYTFTRPEGNVYYEGDDSLKKDQRFSVAYESQLPSQHRYVQPLVRNGPFPTGAFTCPERSTKNPNAVCD